MSINIFRKYGRDIIYTLRTNADTLYKADLEGVFLGSAGLDYKDMQDCNLNSTTLRDASIIQSNLRGAKLCYADVRGADLSFSDLRNADLTATNLINAFLHGALLKGATYRGNKLDKLMSISGVAEYGPIMFYTTLTHQLFVECGCRHMTYAQAVDYWANRTDRVMTRVALAMGKAWYDALPKPVVKKRVVKKNKKSAVKAKAKAKAKRGKK